MSECSGSFEIQIIVKSLEDDKEKVEELTKGLRQELLDLNVDNVDMVEEKDIPDRAKPVEPISLGLLIVKLAFSTGAVTMLLKTIENVVIANKTSSITVKCGDKELSVNGYIAPEERKQLIDNWMSSLQKESP